MASKKKPDGKVDPKKTHDDLILLFGEGIQLAKPTDTEKLETFYARIMKISYEIGIVENEIGYNYMLSLENAFNVFLDIFDRKKLDEYRKNCETAIGVLRDNSASHDKRSFAYLWAAVNVQRMGPSKRNKYINDLKDLYNDVTMSSIKECVSHHACKKIKSEYTEFIEKFKGWQCESCAA